MKPIALCQTTITRAYYMSDTGTRYAFAPGYRPSTITTDSGQTLIDARYFDGFSDEPDRVMVLNEDVELYINNVGELGATLDDPSAVHHYHAAELLRPNGRIADAQYGTTRPLVPGEETTTLDEVKTAVEAAGGSAYVRDLDL